MLWRWCNAFRDDARLIHVHLVLKLQNYKTPRLAAYVDDSANAQSMNSMQILTGFTILYATDNILWLSTEWGARSPPNGLACFVSNSSFVKIFFPIQTRQTHEVWTQFLNFALSKTKFLSRPSKQLRWIHGGAKAIISIIRHFYFRHKFLLVFRLSNINNLISLSYLYDDISSFWDHFWLRHPKIKYNRVYFWQYVVETKD